VISLQNTFPLVGAEDSDIVKFLGHGLDSSYGSEWALLLAIAGNAVRKSRTGIQLNTYHSMFYSFLKT
jgi:hypothetical protein